MPSFLMARLKRLERKIPAPEKQRRVFWVRSDPDKAEARKLLEAGGFDKERGDIIIIRLIVDPPQRSLTPPEDTIASSIHPERT